MLIRFAATALFVGAALVAVPHAQDAKPAAAPVADAVELPALMVGSPAPALTIEKWIKGAPVASFEKGKIYMVEFWATWCGPCIRGMPHLSELQKKYADKGLTIIGVSSKDGRGNSLDKVEEMVAKKGDVMAYTVAWDTERKTNEAWFEAARQQGIPCCFLVDQDGKIAYIGHPMAIDKTLESVVEKKHDIQALAAAYKKRLLNEPKMIALQQELQGAAQAEDWAKTIELCDKLIALDMEETMNIVPTKFLILGKRMNDEEKAYAFAREAHKGIAKNHPQALNALAWSIVDPENGFVKKDLDLALAIATDADKLAGGKDPGILDTLARVHFTKGDAKKAHEIQTTAVELATEKQMKAVLQKSLDEYKAALEKKAGG